MIGEMFRTFSAISTTTFKVPTIIVRQFYRPPPVVPDSKTTNTCNNKTILRISLTILFGMSFISVCNRFKVIVRHSKLLNKAVTSPGKHFRKLFSIMNFSECQKEVI
ncbi:CLUMA_CG018691, isoform A [Clunio marinus]|uniref:CLUMA_CG018691, isoform A n=1 Tax=Clunio marinus TaxID=568069 RepID=A0A1J1IZU0_9DIPT|nr:CLUMA_CG018691, isoform A [Clunio marinus]